VIIMHIHYCRGFILASGTALAVGVCPGALAAYGDPNGFPNLHEMSRSDTEELLAPGDENHPLVTAAFQGEAPRGGLVHDDEDDVGSVQRAGEAVGAGEDASPASADPPERETSRGYGEVLDDAAISVAVRAKLLWSSQADPLSIRVSTESGRVTLAGETESESARSAAERVAAGVAGVSSVRNDMVVRTPSGSGTTPAVRVSLVDSLKGFASTAGRGASDTWTTARVKSALMYTYGLRGGRIAVSTQEGLVTLAGSVGSEEEHARIVDLVRGVRGVVQVDAEKLSQPGG